MSMYMCVCVCACVCVCGLCFVMAMCSSLMKQHIRLKEYFIIIIIIEKVTKRFWVWSNSLTITVQ